MSHPDFSFSRTQLGEAFKPIQAAGRSNIQNLMVVIDSKPLVDLGEKIVEWDTNKPKHFKKFRKLYWPNNGLSVNIASVYDIIKHYQKEGMLIKFQYEADHSAELYHEMVSLSAKSAKKSKKVKSNKPKTKEILLQDTNGDIKVYVDGSCLNNGVSNGNVAAGCGVVFNLKHSL